MCYRCGLDLAEKQEAQKAGLGEEMKQLLKCLCLSRKKVQTPASPIRAHLPSEVWLSLGDSKVRLPL